uniref:OSIGBa0111E13.6 protein n=1 Tax=Oryza sativa TaxID=4530 RepID=Q01KY3_ORYSA|nr:OSIGBa0111E13.6 [Oryza sativa]
MNHAIQKDVTSPLRQKDLEGAKALVAFSSGKAAKGGPVQVPNVADVAKAAAAARALQIRAEILSTSQLVVPQATPSQPAAAPTALAVVQAQVSPDPETQAEADMEAMRQNMTWLQDMLRQMQEQQQAYEAARRTKATSAPILQYSAGYVTPQVHPQVTTQPIPPQAAQQCIRPVTCNCKLNQSLPKYTINHLAKRHKQWRKGLRLCRRNSKLSFSNSTNPTAFQAQPHRPTRRGIQVKVRLIGCHRFSRAWEFRHGIKDCSLTSSMLLRHQPFGNELQASEQTKHQSKLPRRGRSQFLTHPWRLSNCDFGLRHTVPAAKCGKQGGRRKGFGQKPVYFVSEALHGAKTRYIEMEKLAYALVMASRKLKHYFQAHKVIVPSQYPLSEILRGKEVTGRLSKWATELSPFDLHFVARSAIKSQVLADFVAEWTPVLAPDPEPTEQFWVMCSDGSWSHRGAGIAAVLCSPNGVPIRYAARLQFDTTNNAVEYEAVLLGLRKAKAQGVQRLLIQTDSKLVAGHVDKSFEAKEEGMKRYLEVVRSMQKCFTGITVEHLPRDQNEEADALAKSAACGGPHSPGIFFEVLHAPSVPMDSSEVMVIDQEKLGEDSYDWQTPFVKHLQTGWLPVDEAEAKRLQLRATKYKMVSGQLYRSGVLQPLLRCISFSEGEEMAKETHQGLCGAHQAARTVASKVFRQGVYWPTVLKVCVEQIKKCESCQRHGRSQAAPQYDLQPIAPIWPFARWGLDIIRPFPMGRNGYKFAIVAVEYFSRWIEVEPLGAITSAAVQKFVWKNIVCYFRVPKEFITDNGKQFDSDKFREMCEGLNL